VDVNEVLHLVRGLLPAQVVAEHDWVVYLPGLELADHGAPPCSPGPIDHDQLLLLIFAASLVITW
jgi:hypothetical protein